MTTSQVWRSTRWQAAGVSLIEALVALAVMAFGMLGVVGMQSTMRTGADISRQRSEAVRIAQQELERLRNYSVLRAADAAAGQLAFEQIVAAAAASVAASNANTTFFRETLVRAPAASDAMSPVREVRVVVTWADRSASVPNQRVELSSAIAGLPAELSALHAMRTDRSPLRQAYGRNSAIPRSATNDPGGTTSSFSPPGLPGVTWVFNNSTGLITQICSPAPTCTDTERWLLSGYVAFATGGAPSKPEAEGPTDDLPLGVNLSMRVAVLEPGSTADEPCAVGALAGQARRVYYCAVPTENVLTDRYWSGRVVFDTLPLSSTLADTATSNYKVCRYTPDTTNVLPVPPDTLPTVPNGQSVSDYNSRHPYIYYRANGPLQNKNFLVISAGNGITDSFVCPTEDAATPIESNTLPHQPIS
jgi:Tfp pilus assembly protein PilV